MWLGGTKILSLLITECKKFSHGIMTQCCVDEGHLTVCKKLVFRSAAQIEHTAIFASTHKIASVVQTQLAPGSWSFLEIKVICIF
jgi:hypothetical protein